MDSSLDSLRRAQGDFLASVGFGPTECAHRVIASSKSWRLRDYDGKGGTPLLVVAAPIKHPYIWDLIPAVSVVRTCLDHGLHVFLLEWLAPQDNDVALGLDHYAHEAINICIARIVDASGGGKPILIGHSLGGTFAAIHAAAEPQNLRGLVLLGAPLCFASESSAFGDAVAAYAPAQFSHSSVVQGSILSRFCALVAPETFVWSRLADLARGFGDLEAIGMYLRIERWALDEMPLSGRLVEEVIQRLYREDRFRRGQLEIAGRSVGPKQIVAPTLAIVTTSDDVVPRSSVAPLLEAVSSRNAVLIDYPGEAGVGLQHLGILVGRQARRTVWPKIMQWIDDLP
jgi:polyhydroxyalkanoate synthase